MKFIKLSEYLTSLSPIILVISIVIGVYSYKNLNNLHKQLAGYLVLMLIVDIASQVLWRIYNNNLIVLLIYSLVELIYFVYFYNKNLLVKPNKALITIGVLGSTFIIAEILQYFVFNTLDVKQFQPYAKVADNFIVILLALVFFYQKMKDFRETKWNNFRLNIVILVFFTFNTIIFLPLNFMINESSGVKYYFWTGNLVLLLLFYIYLTSLIWKNGLQNRRLTSTQK